VTDGMTQMENSMTRFCLSRNHSRLLQLPENSVLMPRRSGEVLDLVCRVETRPS
jgi:hypothetical protein